MSGKRKSDFGNMPLHLVQGYSISSPAMAHEANNEGLGTGLYDLNKTPGQASQAVCSEC